MKKRAHLFTLFLIAILAINTACNVIEPTPTPTLILPEPLPDVAGTTSTAQVTPERTEATPTVETPAVETATPELKTPQATVTPERSLRDASPALETGSGDWPMAHYNYENSRANLAATLGEHGLVAMQQVWRFTAQSAVGGAGLSSPVVFEETVYLQDGQSSLFALDLQSGQLKWEYRLELPSSTPKGPGLGYGKVFIPAGDDQVHALEMETGQLIWSATLPGARGLHQPYIFGGLVLTGTVADPAVQGSATVYALDQETGEIAWQYQAGADLWDAAPDGTEAGVSNPPAVDTARGFGFWGTGSPARLPEADQNPDDSPELDLSANSILALDLATGQMAWFGDLSAGEFFGQDARVSPLLIEASLDGQSRELVLGAGRFGSLAALDRETGQPVWRITLGESAGSLQVSQPGGEDSQQPAGSLGGVHGPLAFADGILYVPITRLAAGSPTLPDGAPDMSLASGELIAVDVHTGQVLWARIFDGALTGGATVNGGLVFTMTHTGAIYAIDRQNGSVVWHAISAPEPHFFPVIAGDLVLVPGSGARNDTVSLIALRPGLARTPTPLGSSTPTLAPTPTPGLLTPTPTPDATPLVTPTPADETPPAETATPEQP